jgi:hypothetical protein
MRLTLIVCVLVSALAALAACGDDDDSDGNTGDPRISQIGGVAELATYAYAATEGEGLLDYVSSDIAENCTKDEVTEALADEPVPTGFRTMKDVKFDGEDRATATVVLITEDGDKEVEWSFVREGEDSWRIKEIPGLSEEDCSAS